MSTKASWGAENGQGWVYPSLQGRSSEYVPPPGKMALGSAQEPRLGDLGQKGGGRQPSAEGTAGVSEYLPYFPVPPLFLEQSTELLRVHW